MSEYCELTPEEEERYETAYDLIEALRGAGVIFRLVDGKVHFKPAGLISDVGRAELTRCKAEVYELLREEEECEAQWEARLASQSEVDPLPDDEWAEFGELTGDEQVALGRWISQTLEPDPDRRPSSRHTSYHLKHVFERSPGGFYVTDAQFRAAMWLSGFLGRRYPGRRYEDLESRFFYVRPNREGFARKLVEYAGMPEGWAREAMGAHRPLYTS